MSKTYRIDTMGGPLARWLPSLDAAKERYRTATLDAWERDELETPVITFETSNEDEDGHPCAEYTRCLTDGRWDSSICIERPAWPSWEFEHGASPDLAMRRTTGVNLCSHQRLICSNTCTPRDGIPEPRIRCAACGATWEPEQ